MRRTGRIHREDMLAIVRGAVALTFPSRYEGFGLPALEAMSLGTPVLAGDAAALPEVVGDGGACSTPTTPMLGAKQCSNCCTTATNESG